MKAVINGALHVSTLDGWWAEAWTPETGWAIGHGEVYNDPGYQDEVEATALYNLLEKEIIPLFYERDLNGLPTGWLARMKRSIQAYGPIFNTHRMVQQYSQQFYVPAAKVYQRFLAGNQQRAKELAEWKRWVRQVWPQVKIERVEDAGESNLEAGGSLPVQASINLGALRPEDVSVEVYYGAVDVRGEFIAAEKMVLSTCQDQGGGRFLYSGAILCRLSGRQGYKLRIRPHHEDLNPPYLSGLLLWG